MSKYISQYSAIPSAQSGDLFLVSRSNVYKKLDYDDLVSSVSASVGTGVTTLAELTDIDLTYLSNSDILQYNSSTLKWEAVSLPSSVTFSGSAGYLSKFSSTTDINDSIIYQVSTSVLGFFGVTSSSYSFALGGNVARSIAMERHTTAATAGNNLTIQAGGAYTGGTNLAGGIAIISSGIATGSGGAGVQIHTTTAGASGTTDRNPTLKATFTGTGHLNMETSGFIQMNGYTWIHYTNSGTAAPQSNGCTFVGYNVGLSNANNGNSGFGQEALKSVGNGSNNSAFGRFALTELTTGVNNTACGFYAGSGISTTSYNAFFGGYAGSNTTASYNSAFGYNAMPNNTSGGYNTGVGNDSLYSLTSATYSVGIGFNTLNGTSISGAGNVAVGANAGSYVRTTSAYNTFIGEGTGVIILTSPYSYSVALGAKSIVTASNIAVFGGSSDTSKINTFYLGTSPLYDATSGAVTQSTITLQAGGTYYNSGANMGGHNLAICAGLATGSGSAGTGFGDLYLQTTTVTGSGSTLGTATTRITIKGGTGEIIPVLPTSSAGLATGALWNDSGTVKVA